MFQIGTGEAVFRNLADAAVFHIRAEDGRPYRTDLRFTLAAVAFNHHHALPLVGGNQAIADKLLQSWNVLGVKQPIQKVQPDHRCRSIGIIADRQTASHDSRSAFGESAVQEQRTVGNMDAILLRREVRHLRFQFQHFQNVGDLPWDVVHGTKFQLVVNLPTQRKVIRHSTIGREKSSVCEDDSALMQKFFTKTELR